MITAVKARLVTQLQVKTPEIALDQSQEIRGRFD